MPARAARGGPFSGTVCRRILLLPVILTAGCQRPAPVASVPSRCGAHHEARLIEVINIARHDRGLPTLQPNARLATAAARHSADMARNRFMSHTGSDDSTFDQRIAATGYRMRYTGEVVATGYQSPVTVVANWLRSPRHRDVLLSDEAVDIGAACFTDDNGRPYWTAVVGALLGV